LIDLTHSVHPSLKILAAGEIRHFFKYFPDLEEAAINAIYDLCEDHDPEVGPSSVETHIKKFSNAWFFFQVRKGGYSAVTQVSRERTNWVKRNADVLVQLLQSGESFPG